METDLIVYLFFFHHIINMMTTLIIGAVIVIIIIYLIYSKTLGSKFDTTYTIINTNSSITSPSYLSSVDGKYALMYKDGAVSMYSTTKKLYDLVMSSATSIKVGLSSKLTITDDHDTSLWTSPVPANYVQIDKVGNLVLYDANKTAICLINALGASLTSITTVNSSINAISVDGSYLFKNYVMYKVKDMSVVWDLRKFMTLPETVDRLSMQGDGNLVAYSKNTALWSTYPSSARVAYIDTFGNIICADPSGKVICMVNSMGVLHVESPIWCLNVGHSLISPNLQYILGVDYTNTFTCKDTTGKVKWTFPATGATGLCNHGGNITLYGPEATNNVKFSSQYAIAGAYMYLDDSGALRVKRKDGSLIAFCDSNGFQFTFMQALRGGFNQPLGVKWLASPSGKYILKIVPTDSAAISGVLGMYKSDGTLVYQLLKNNAVVDRYELSVDGKLYISYKNANVWVSSVASPNAIMTIDDSNGNIVINSTSGQEILRITGPQ